MELLNATGETIRQMYDGKVYEIEPSEVVSVTDDAGTFLLFKQSVRGLQQVSYGDDADKLTYQAISSVVAFHRRQIEEHEALNKTQSEKKFPLVDEPKGVKQARAALKVYEPLFAKMTEAREEVEQVELEEQITSAVGKALDIPSLEDMNLEDLRTKLTRMGDTSGGALNRKSLISRIKKMQAAIESEQEVELP
jgi:hypothetical protein